MSNEPKKDRHSTSTQTTADLKALPSLVKRLMRSKHLAHSLLLVVDARDTHPPAAASGISCLPLSSLPSIISDQARFISSVISRRRQRCARVQKFRPGPAHHFFTFGPARPGPARPNFGPLRPNYFFT